MSLLKILNTTKGIFLYDAKTHKLLNINQFYCDMFEKYIEDGSINENYEILSRKLGRLLDNDKFIIRAPFSEKNMEWICNNTLQQLILSVTENCNMRCKYCTYHNKYDSEYKFGNMSIETAHKAIDIFLQKSIKNDEVFISFYGGEPLLRKDFVKECVEYALSKSNGQHVKFAITTNGTLLDEEFIEYLIDHNFFVAISLDGPRQMNDRYRVFPDNAPTYDVVINNLKEIYRKDFIFAKNNIVLQCTYAPPKNDNLIYNFFENLPFRNLITNVVKTSYFKKYLEDCESGKDISYSFDEKMKYDFFKNSLEGSYKKYANLIPIHPDSQYVFPSGSCIPINKKLFVKDNGNFYFCERVNENDKENIVGNVDEGIDVKKIMNLYEKMTDVFSHQNCGECWAVHFCTFCFRDIKSINDDSCEKMREQIQNEFIRFIEQFI